MAYTPVGTGGARCYTDERARPNFRGATNFIQLDGVKTCERYPRVVCCREAADDWLDTDGTYLRAFFR